MKIELITCCLFITVISNAQNIGLGNQSPTEKLDVSGNIKADTVKTGTLKIATNAGQGKILMSDGNGNAGWQNGGNLIKVHNGLTKVNDTINFGGRLYQSNTEIKLAQNELSFKDIGTTVLTLASSTPAASNQVLGSTPVTQTFRPSSTAQLSEVQLSITALSGGTIVLQLKNNSGAILATASKNYGVLTNGFDPFPLNVYVENSEIYTLSVTGNASAFLNYDMSSNPYPEGSSSLGANSDLAFKVSGSGEATLLSLKANRVGIGTNAPTEELEVSGNVKATNVIATNSLQLSNGAGLGKVLTSDGTGTGSWEASRKIPGSIDSVVYLRGQIFSPVPGPINTWDFFGPTSTVTLTSNQSIVMVSTAVLGRSSAGATGFRLDVGYQLSPGGQIRNASGSSYMQFIPAIPAGSSKTGYTMVGTFKPGAGTYIIGNVIYCSTSAYLNYNDYLNGYFMIVNE